MSADFKHVNLLEHLFISRSSNQQTSLEHLLRA
jgi:hypothetical protein